VNWTHLAQNTDQWRAVMNEHGNKPSCSMRDREFLDLLSDCYLLKKDFPPWS
jgi:hypothetical protein